MPTVKISIAGSTALLCALAAGTASCVQDSTGPTGLELPQAAFPDTVVLGLGEQMDLRAMTGYSGNADDLSVVISNESVASLEGTVITAFGPGQAVITVTAKNGPAEPITTLVNVPKFWKPVRTLSSVKIEAVTDARGVPLPDLAAVSGSIVARLSIQRGSAERLEVLMNDTISCSLLFPPRDSTAKESSTAAIGFNCPINTAAYDTATGAPAFPNGPAKLNARLLNPDGVVVATAGELPLQLQNQDTLVARIGASQKARDAAGQLWVNGDVSVTTVPVSYRGGSGFSEVRLTYFGPGGARGVAADSSAPFSFSLPVDELRGNVHDGLRVVMTSVTTGGLPGPSWESETFGYDNLPPAPGALQPREWIGAETRFMESYVPADGADPGVGRGFVRFLAGDPAASFETILQKGQAVESGSDLAPSATSQAYRLAAHVCDLLLNCVAVEGYLFGVDLAAPTIDQISLEDRVINPGVDLTLTVRDEGGSGVPARPLEAAVKLLDSDPATPVCGLTVEGVTLPGSMRNVCVPDTVASPLSVPRTTPGYYSYAITAFDRAGNRSATVTRTVLVDREAPRVGAVVVPQQLVGGGDAAVRAEIADNLDLTHASFGWVYPLPDRIGRVTVPFSDATVVGMAFDHTLTTEASASGSLPFVRTLTYGTRSGGPRATVLVDSLEVATRDAAGLRSASRRAVPPALFGNDVSVTDPFSKYTTISAAVDPAGVCTIRCEAGDPKSLVATVQVVGQGTGPVAPFARLHLYRRGTDGLAVRIGSVSGIPTLTSDTGAQTTFTYSFPEYTPPAGLAGRFTIFAVGVSSRGHGMATEVSGTGTPEVEFYRR